MVIVVVFIFFLKKTSVYVVFPQVVFASAAGCTRGLQPSADAQGAAPPLSPASPDGCKVPFENRISDFLKTKKN
jgi:hypothetical protein